MLREYLSNIADKFRTYLDTTEPINAQDFVNKIGEVYNKGFENGYSGAVREGTITVTKNTKELAISSLPSEPRRFIVFTLSYKIPQTEAKTETWVRGLEYLQEGFTQGTSTRVRVANIYYVSNDGASSHNTTMFKEAADTENLITFDNGTFTIKMSDTDAMHYAEKFTYKWIAIF